LNAPRDFGHDSISEVSSVGPLIMLGAGASRAGPTFMPAFDGMRTAILARLGWRWDAGSRSYVHPEPIGRRQFPPLSSARLTARDAPAEVVFGTLHRFEIPFAAQVESTLAEWQPRFNAVHLASATALRGGCPVWTPNIDLGVERACSSPTEALPKRVIVGERGEDGKPVPVDFGSVDTTTLLKFHGSVDAPGSLAFTDLQLLAPYSDDEVQHLARLARDRTFVLYGYAGKDADLRRLLIASMSAATDVRWFEPSNAVRDYIRRSFRDVQVSFDPDELPYDDSRVADNVEVTASSFLSYADSEDLLEHAGPEIRRSLGTTETRDVSFDFDPPAIAQARLVERFGRAGDVAWALAAARRADLLRPRPTHVSAHCRWALSRSLYSDKGLLRRVIGAAARRPKALRYAPHRIASVVYDKGTAVLLPAGEIDALYDLTTQAREQPWREGGLRHGSDLYYRAHALRYLDRPEEARVMLDKAGRLLVDRWGGSDAERYAGVLLDAGIVALYQARIDDAFEAADALVFGPGCYAIGRWSGWGHWLWAMSHLYSCAFPGADVDIDAATKKADEHIDAAEADFCDSELDRARGDVQVLRLLRHRLRIAAGHDEDPPETSARLTRRQSDDIALLHADIALARGHFEQADARLSVVERASATAVAVAWSRFGRAVIAHRTRAAGPDLADIEGDAIRVGAWWLAAQARLARGDAEVEVEHAPHRPRVRAVGAPSVLWLLT
jgi:hypothetical protein